MNKVQLVIGIYLTLILSFSQVKAACQARTPIDCDMTDDIGMLQSVLVNRHCFDRHHFICFQVL
jgi:hypothetical protein